MRKKIPDPNKMKRVKGPKLSEKQLKSVKVKITTFLDEDVLMALRKAAEESGGKYQTLMNQLLKNVLLGKKQGIIERLEKLEEKVFKKKAA